MSADAVLWIVMAFCLIVGCPIFVSLGVASTLALILTNIPMRIVALDMLKAYLPVSLAAQWVLYLLPWPLLALFGRMTPFCSIFARRPCVGSNAELSRAAVLAVRLLPPVLVGAALWFALARVPLVWFWPVAMASAGCTVAALGMVYDAVRVLQVPGRATFCDLGIVIQVYREVS